MKYAEVAVDAPVGYDRTLSYSVPAGMNLVPGQMVWVPLGQRLVQGIVFELTAQPQVEPVRDVASAIQPAPLISSTGLALARWLSHYYMSSLFEAAALMLPPGFRTRVRSFLQLSPTVAESGPPPEVEQALPLLSRVRSVPEARLIKSLGPGGERVVASLLRRGLLQRSWELPRPRVAMHYQCLLRLALPEPQLQARLQDLSSRAQRQADLIRDLLAAGGQLALEEARQRHGPAAVQGAWAGGLVYREWVRVLRRPPMPGLEPVEPAPVTLTPEQGHALSQIVAALEGRSPGPRSFLLHGVTASGKTEVYIRALAHCLAQGRRGILLVPEISLTPQMVQRLTARFPGRVAVMHSALTQGQLFDQWWEVHDGTYDIVVGPRSALFAPMADLGLIIVDEEHEWTYKQQESAPHYHAREAALKLAELSGAVVVLGSATPDVVTYYQATTGLHQLLEMPHRVVPTPEAPLPKVEVVDMRRELKEGNRSIFSRALSQALSTCLAQGGQAILFLNRRGSASVVQCRDCGHTMRCRGCDTALTYHADGHLLCHQCNRRRRPVTSCPQCRSPRIRYLGLGTQRVVQELSRLFPGEPVLRWDRDAVRAAQGSDGSGGPVGHAVLMERFARGEARILVGTQMVAKGLHVPSVSLVGVVLADVGLNLPDIRAGERIFQLLYQVAGRAGRGSAPGRVIIQTYNPDHYALVAAAAQDYALFYKQELDYRRRLRHPPFSRLARLLYSHRNAALCQREAEELARALRQRAYATGLADVELVGPAPAFPPRLRGTYRWHLVLRGPDPRGFLEGLRIPQGWLWDIDPVTLL